MARPRRRTDSGAAAPVDELGIQIDSGQTTHALTGRTAPWSTFVDQSEFVPELTWPNSISVFDQMRTDSQISGLLSAVIFGISQLRFLIDPNGAKPEIVKEISEDLNVPVQGDDAAPRARMKHRFAHTKHLGQALLALAYGHMYFEQVGAIVDGKWRLRKLAPRMPHTIGEIVVAEDGGLVAIRQNIGHRGTFYQPPAIPVDRLTAFVFQQEGPNWVGRSMLRDLYKNWLIKDRLLRIDAINHERAGGVPYASAAPGATPSEIDDLHEQMRQFKIGDTSGGALPAGAKLNIAKGSGGAVADSIRLHDEAMARRFLLMVTSLAQGGTSIGSYSLGQVFADFFTIGQRAIVQWYCDTMNEHVIEDYVDWNYGSQEEQAPVLIWEGEDDVLGPDMLASLVDKGVIIVDDEFEDAIRYKYRYPPRKTPRPTQTGTADGQESGAPSPSEPSTTPAKEKVNG